MISHCMLGCFRAYLIQLARNFNVKVGSFCAPVIDPYALMVILVKWGMVFYKISFCSEEVELNG